MHHMAESLYGQRLFVTDRIDWNEQTLSRRIEENETIIQRIRAARDNGVVWIARHLERDTDRKRRMLERMQGLDQSQARRWLEASLW